VRQQLVGTPLTAVLNFPRLQEVQAAHELGVAEIVSKPFAIEDLKFAVERSIAGVSNATASAVPRPHAVRSTNPTVK
jgi:DNA-binding NtrC family response regulator